MKNKIFFVLLVFSIVMNAQSLFMNVPLAKGNNWVILTTAQFSPNTNRFYEKLLDSTATINGRNYFICESRYPENTPSYQYWRYDSTDHYYKMYGTYLTENGNGEEFIYWKKDIKINDQWIQKGKFDRRPFYFTLLDTTQAYVFGKLTTIKFLFVTDSALIYETQHWTDDFGWLRYGFEAGADFLLGCIINGKVYGDTTFYTTDIEIQNISKPQDFILYQNYPNPFNPVTKIKFYLPQQCYVTLKIYDVLGKEIDVLVSENKAVGIHEVKFDGTKLSAGLYLYRLDTGIFSKTKKLILLK